MLKKQVAVCMHKYRVLLLLVLIFIIISLIFGLLYYLAGDRLDIDIHSHILKNVTGKYIIYPLRVCTNKGNHDCFRGYKG